jgi:hypothetical protein
MNILKILETFGVPITMCVAFGFFIWKQNKWIQEDLKKAMKEDSARIEDIVIGLINASKKNQIDTAKELARIEGSMRMLPTLVQKLTGNGLKK